MQACPICGSAPRILHTATVLGRHQVNYLRCPRCEFCFIAEPTWLEEAYADAIASTDTGLVARNLEMRDLLVPVLRRCFNPRGRFVDYAGGYGLLVRLMRDAGLDFYWQDAHCQNLFAQGFEWSQVLGAADAVTAIEVLEHVINPVAFIQECRDTTGADSIIFTQQLHSGSVDPHWWYLTPETGQHISFYSHVTLQRLAEATGLQYHGAGTLHMLTKRDVRRGFFASSVRAARIAARLRRRRGRSLLEEDHAAALKRVAAQRDG